MSIFTWDDAYSVNVPEIDAQHRGLVDLINTLHLVLTTEDDSGRLVEAKARTIEALVEYGNKHFQSEDDFMRAMNFPDLEEHRREHQIFVATVNEYREELTTVHAVRTTQVMKIMTDWLHDHLLTKDQKYAEYAAGLR
jgi:hemerythrin